MPKKNYRLRQDHIFLAGWIFYFGLFVAEQFSTVPNWLLAQGRDILLVPCVLPLIIVALTRLNLRTSSPPSIIEILLSLLIWSIMFEFLGPRFFDHAVSDLLDILAYGFGGILSALYWRFTFK